MYNDFSEIGRRRIRFAWCSLVTPPDIGALRLYGSRNQVKLIATFSKTSSISTTYIHTECRPESRQTRWPLDAQNASIIKTTLRASDTPTHYHHLRTRQSFSTFLEPASPRTTTHQLLMLSSLRESSLSISRPMPSLECPLTWSVCQVSLMEMRAVCP